MNTRPPPLPSRELVELARLVMARSAKDRVEHRTPPDLGALLAAIDEAEARHEAQVAVAQVGGAPERA